MLIDFSPFLISIKTAFIATLITVCFGVSAAYWMLGYQGKWKSLIEGTFIAPLILPPTVVGFLLLLLLGKNGIFGKLLFQLNINIVFTGYAAIIAATVVAFPLIYKTTLGAFEQIDNNLLQVSRTLGASEIMVFFRVALPLAWPGILSGIVLAFCRALGEFGATLMLAGNIPGETQTIPMAIYFAVASGAMKEAGFWVFVIVIISFFALSFVNFWNAKKEKWRIGNRNKKNQKFIDSSAISESFFLTDSVKLSVEIQKQLSDFLLNVKFNSHDSPLGLLGASGAGKSMILRCIAGIETPDQGRIILNGKILFDSELGINLPPRERHIGFLFQNYALFPHLTVSQNIAFAFPQKMSQLQLKQQIEILLAKVHLSGFENRYPYQLSGGQQQRVALARALASNPEVLLLDEPFSALDTYLRSQLEKQVSSVLKNYAGVTLLVTHNLEEVYRICENLLVLDQGIVIAAGSKQRIFQHPNNVKTAQVTECKNISQARIKNPQTIEATDWGCTLQVLEPIPTSPFYVGIRAHQLSFPATANQENTFPCWLVNTSETQHQLTVYIKLFSPPHHAEDYHLQAEIFKEKWETLKDRPFPWLVQIDPRRLFLMPA